MVWGSFVLLLSHVVATRNVRMGDFVVVRVVDALDTDGRTIM